MEKADINGDIRRTTCAFSQELFEENIIHYILESMSPLSTVVFPAFRRMFYSFRVKHGDKSLKHLTRNTLKKKIDIVYREQMEIKNHLKNVQYVCTTADIWTALYRRFIGVTAHWLCDKTLKRKSAALACKINNKRYQNALFRLNNEKIVVMVTDNGSNFIKAIKIFGLSNEDNDENINESDDLNDDDNYIPDNYYSIDSNEISNEIDIILSQHLRCASHKLNLIVSSDAAKIINDDSRLKRLYEKAIEECDKLWRKLKSPKNREALKKYLTCALKRPVVTRWNSLYDCLSKLKSISGSLILDTYLRDYLTCMETLTVGIDKVQTETSCYYGCLLPLLLSIKNKWTAILRDNRVIYCKKLVEGMQQRLINRFSDFFEIDGHGEAAALAAITHPQFKDPWLSCLSDDKILKIQKLVRAAFSVSENESNEILDETEQDDFFDFGEGSTEANRKLQIFTYPGENSVEMCEFFSNPIGALDMLHQFPRVKQLFIKYNTCIPSSTSVERQFSYATMMNIAKYNR
ncbi:hypothetical protein ALC57_04404 [Trachymyrmex cornetzi]|uniref:HAT C-terminal dimerisation domain-containing protein n=1 Tax=Trachymyrmex cornetzi TaxID=471704 RepID=A0A151JCB8_9HYME|nr:hypothetical protein ALC57_04404 [Trachymyrmex cornetzi]